MTSMPNEENLNIRLLLQNKFDRIENLVKMNHAATLAVPSVLAAIWAIDIRGTPSENVCILCVISIGLLLLWRYFAHSLDDDVAKTYTQILDLELKLKISKEFTIRDRLIDDIWDSQSCEEIKSWQIKKRLECFFKLINIKKINAWKVNFPQLTYNQQISFLSKLIKDRKICSRGHNTWDILAFFLIIGIMEFFLWSLVIESHLKNTVIHILCAQILSGIIIVLLMIFFNCITPIQKDPKTDDIIAIFNKICPKNLIIK
jgi:hypothetical protein